MTSVPVTQTKPVAFGNSYYFKIPKQYITNQLISDINNVDIDVYSNRMKLISFKDINIKLYSKSYYILIPIENIHQFREGGIISIHKTYDLKVSQILENGNPILN